MKSDTQTEISLKGSGTMGGDRDSLSLDGKVGALSYTCLCSHGNLKYAHFAVLLFAKLSIGEVSDSSQYPCAHKNPIFSAGNENIEYAKIVSS